MTTHHDFQVPEYVPIKPWRLYLRIVFLVVMVAGTGIALFSIMLGAARSIAFNDAVFLFSFVCFFPLSLVNIYASALLLNKRTSLYYQRSKRMNRIYWVLLVMFLIPFIIYWIEGHIYAPYSIIHVIDIS